MNIEKELSTLHGELYELYQGRSTNVVRIHQLWQRIDQLEFLKIDGGE